MQYSVIFSRVIPLILSWILTASFSHCYETFSFACYNPFIAYSRFFYCVFRICSTGIIDKIENNTCSLLLKTTIFPYQINVYCSPFLDVNECAENSHDCDKNAKCFNTQGSFTCICNRGYQGSGRKDQCFREFVLSCATSHMLTEWCCHIDTDDNYLSVCFLMPQQLPSFFLLKASASVNAGATRIAAVMMAAGSATRAHANTRWCATIARTECRKARPISTLSRKTGVVDKVDQCRG